MHKIHTQNLLNLSIDKKLRPQRAESERPRPGELPYANSRKLKNRQPPLRLPIANYSALASRELENSFCHKP